MNKHIRIGDWFLVKLSGDNYYRLEFVNSVTEEVTNKMWNDLDEGIKKWNIKIISCYKAFRHTNIRKFIIPSQYEHLFDEMCDVNYMFEYSRIEVLNIKFKSTSLDHANFMCSDCKRLEHVHVSFNSEASLRYMFNGCLSLKTLRLIFNCCVDVYRLCFGCNEFSILDLRFKDRALYKLLTSGFMNADIKNDTINYVNYSNHPYRISNISPKYCESINKIS